MTFSQAVAAIRGGQVDVLAALLADDPGLANQQPKDNPRSLLHHATDWPGHWEDVAESIRLLVQAGANVEVRFPSDSPKVAETPLHWAASSGDAAAVEALLDAGATVDVLGGIFGGCTPFAEAIIFEKYDAARLLLDHGATNYLPGVAALGLADRVDAHFGPDGSVEATLSQLPDQEEPPDAQVVLDRSFQFACRAGHLDIAKVLLDRGADPTAISPANTTALEMAVENKHNLVVQWIDTLLQDE